MRIDSIGAEFGARVSDVRLSRLTDDEFAAMEEAFHRYAVLIFPGANLTEAEHIAFSRRFGRLERTLSKRTERQEISLLSNVTGAGSVAGPDETLGLFLKGNRYWHTDSSFKKVGAKMSLLRAVQAPAEGGDTEWADMRAAWDCLPPHRRERLEGLTAVHSYAYSQGLVGGIALLNQRERDDLPPVEHPLVRIHPADRAQESLSRTPHRAHRRHGARDGPGARGGADGGCLPAAAILPASLAKRRHRRLGQPLRIASRTPWPFEQRRVMKRTTVAGDGDNPWALPEEADIERERALA